MEEARGVQWQPAAAHCQLPGEHLTSRRVEVSERFHVAPGEEPETGPDPEGRSYMTYASFEDPRQQLAAPGDHRAPAGTVVTTSERKD